jgi:arylsulfatase A-like enzyme
MKEGPDGENLSMRLAHETASFIETHTRRNKKQPFFAFLSFYAVHAPIETTEAKWRHFRNKADSMGIAPVGFEVDRTLPVRLQQDNPIYAGLIQQMDDAVGVVLAKLHELGLDENTIIVFTSDNGGVSSGDAYATSNYPLRGGKGRQWEGGIRVPLFIDFPGNTLKGDSCVVPVTGADLYPTFLDMAGIPLMPGQHQDGVSLLPLLQGKSIPERALYWHYPHYGNQGGEPSSIIRQGDWKLIHYYEDGRDELYNLRIDETESEPLNVQYPEKVEFLSKKLSVWLTEVGARYPEPDPQYNPAAEALYKKKTRERMMKTLEATRKKQLGKDFKPNADWWGSETKD